MKSKGRTKKQKGVSTLSLFSGGGGLDLGFSAAGFDVKACIDTDPYSCKTVEINATKKPLDDPRIRQAIAYAIDRQEVIDAVMLGNAKVTAPVPEGMGAYSADWKTLDGYQVDLEKAKALLKEAGYPDGLKIELKT